jgi:3-oxoacyl-[acyl-carrier protein] reductase
MPSDFSGQVCVVTGTSRGIGWVLCKDFAAHGATVVGAARNEAALDKLAQEIAAAGGRFVPVIADLSKIESCERLVKRALGELGRIDVLVNNLGISGAHKPVRDLQPSEWQEALETNLTSVYACVHYAVGSMIDRKRGAIINVSAIGTKLPSPMRLAYVATKMGMIGMTRVLAHELGPHNIRVNAVSPGFVDGERSDEVMERMSKNFDMSKEQVKGMILKASALGRSVPPGDISSMVLYLASDLGKSITGQDINVDAGMTFS